MKLLADENIARQIVDRLRHEEHDVLSVTEIAPGRNDNDFGGLIMLQRRPSTGIILMRVEGIPPLERAELVAEVVREHASELAGTFVVIKKNSLRIRALPA